MWVNNNTFHKWTIREPGQLEKWTFREDLLYMKNRKNCETLANNISQDSQHNFAKFCYNKRPMVRNMFRKLKFAFRKNVKNIYIFVMLKKNCKIF